MKISACVIVKNEEQNIGRWISCMRQAAEELIIVDTGSTDRTLDIVRAAGIRPYEFAWIDDFSAAKNYALEQATGDWVCFLDADEFMEAKDSQRLSAVLERLWKTHRADVLTCTWVNVDTDRGNHVISREYVQRIFRNLPYLRYRGAIHEYLSAGERDKSIINVLDESIVIYHTGYSQSLMEAKGHRNLALLQAEAERNGFSEEHAVYFCDCYFGLGDMENALKYARIAAELPRERQLLPGEEYHIYFAALENMGQGDREEYASILPKAVQRYPEIASFWVRWGLYLHRSGHYSEAREKLVQALDCLATNKKSTARDIVVEKGQDLFPEAFSLLARYDRMRREQGKAIKHLVQALKLFPHEKRLLRELFLSMRDMPQKKAMKALDSIYDRKRDAAFLLSELKDTPLWGCMRYYAGGKRELPPELCETRLQELAPAERYAMQGDYGKAVDALRETTPELFDFSVLTACEMNLFEQDRITQAALPESWQQAWAAIRQSDGWSGMHVLSIRTLQQQIFSGSTWRKQPTRRTASDPSHGDVRDKLRRLQELLQLRK
ncbi:MAG: glycosyltransferase family 2 protein [Selenomonadaceae bacterium]|nr:glycosyltransferase family 2 protein [Selenomonadaceae bacterium]